MPQACIFAHDSRLATAIKLRGRRNGQTPTLGAPSEASVEYQGGGQVPDKGVINITVQAVPV